MKYLVLSLILVFSLITANSYADELQDISDELVKDCSTFEQKITILMNHVFDKMKPNGNGITLAEARRMTNKQKYFAGVGWCNHQVDVFMELAQRQGIRTRMLYLLNEDKSSSPHTIAEAMYESKWIVVDVANNFIFKKPNGQLMSRTDMANNWEKCLKLLLTITPDEKYWECFLRDCYKVKVLEP